MNENIPFNDINPEADAEYNNPGAYLILHNVWREIFGEKDETDESGSLDEGRE